MTPYGTFLRSLQHIHGHRKFITNVVATKCSIVKAWKRSDSEITLKCIIQAYETHLACGPYECCSVGPQARWIMCGQPYGLDQAHRFPLSHTISSIHDTHSGHSRSCAACTDCLGWSRTEPDVKSVWGQSRTHGTWGPPSTPSDHMWSGSQVWHLPQEACGSTPDTGAVLEAGWWDSVEQIQCTSCIFCNPWYN